MLQCSVQKEDLIKALIADGRAMLEHSNVLTRWKKGNSAFEACKNLNKIILGIGLLGNLITWLGGQRALINTE